MYFLPFINKGGITMQPQVPLIQNKLDDIVNSCQDMIEFKLPKVVWTRWLNEGIMDLYDVLYIEADAILTREDGVEYFELPNDFKQMYMIGTLSDDEDYMPEGNKRCYLWQDDREPMVWDIASKKPWDYKFANAVSDGTYSIFDGKLIINGYTGHTINIKYFRKPKFLAAVNGQDDIDIPNEYIEAVKLYACAQAMKAEDETDRYNLFLSSYKSKKDMLYKYGNRYRPERKLYWKVRR